MTQEAIVIETAKIMYNKLLIGMITAREYADFLAQTDKMFKRLNAIKEGELK